MKSHNLMKNALKTFGVLLAALIFSANFFPSMQSLARLPEKIFICKGEEKPIELQLPFFISASGRNCEVIKLTEEAFEGESRGDTGNQVRISPSNGDASVQLDLFGLIPIKNISIKVLDEKKLIPGGQSLGVTLHTKGALVVGTSDIADSGGNMKNPAREAGLAPGDVIEKARGTEIENADHLLSIINSGNGGKVELEVLRDGTSFKVEVQPVKDAHDGKYRLGIWVRDSTAGVGTMTYYDPLNEHFGALGHAITDVDTKSRLTVKEGEIFESHIIDIKQGEAGEPGELHGSFSKNRKPLGRITANTAFGIFGIVYEEIPNNLYQEPIEIASQYEAKEGPAKILTTIDDTGVRAFDCTIVRVNAQSAPQPKGMVIRITDEELLKKTGGIVQGMSGSPIIQNGKLLGAITHVFINDPTRGYGIFIEWMLEESDAVEKNNL